VQADVFGFALSVCAGICVYLGQEFVGQPDCDNRADLGPARPALLLDLAEPTLDRLVLVLGWVEPSHHRPTAAHRGFTLDVLWLFRVVQAITRHQFDAAPEEQTQALIASLKPGCSRSVG